MHRIRVIATILSALALVASLAGPAAANSAGVITSGVAVVGKNVSFCNHDGISDVSGPGIGYPGLTEPKQAYYALRDVGVTVVNDVTKTGKTGASTGILNACGRLRWVGKIADGTAIGAACGMSKGYHGKGRIVWDAGTPKAATGPYYLHDITWKATAAGSIPFWASGQQGAIGKGQSGTDLVTGVVNATPDPTNPQGSCVSKTGSGTGKSLGGRRFLVNGAFDVVNDAWADPQQPGIGTLEAPGICKNTGNPLCAYDTKKPQTNKG